MSHLIGVRLQAAGESQAGFRVVLLIRAHYDGVRAGFVGWSDLLRDLASTNLPEIGHGGLGGRGGSWCGNVGGLA